MSWFDVTRNISRALKERSMSAVAQSLTLSDGRVEDVLLGGDPTGYPLVMHHGTPADSTTLGMPWWATSTRRTL